MHVLTSVSFAAAILCLVVAIVLYKRQTNDRRRAGPALWAIGFVALLCAGAVLCSRDLKQMGKERALLEHEYARKLKDVKFQPYSKTSDLPSPHGAWVYLIMEGGESHAFNLKVGPDRKPRLYREDD